MNIDVPIDFLSVHPRVDMATARAAIEDLIFGRPDARLCCIISISSTGSLEHLLRELLNELNIQNKQEDVTSIFAFANAKDDVHALCQLPESPLSAVSAADCEHCKRGSTPLVIDPSLYYVSSAEEAPVVLRHDRFKNNDFIERYRNVPDLFFLHRDDPNDGRHHCFDVDVARLCLVEDFKARILKTLRSIPRPDVLIAPPHQAGLALLQIAKSVYDVPSVVHNNLRDDGDLRAEDKQHLLHARKLLIIDDVINTGTRLDAYNRILRQNYGDFDVVNFLVGLCRTKTPADLDTARRGLTTNHPWSSSLHFVEKIHLPCWTATECPWCEEYRIIGEIVVGLSTAPPWLIARLTRLQNRLRGIADEPLIAPAGVSHPTLGSGSIVGSEGLTAVQSLFSLASGLQHLRSHEDTQKRLGVVFPTSQMFASRNVELYSEGLLRACLLRLVQPAEWSERERLTLQEKLEHYMNQPDQAIIHGEVLFAMLRRAVPALPRGKFEGLFGQVLGSALSPCCDLLRI